MIGLKFQGGFNMESGDYGARSTRNATARLVLTTNEIPLGNERRSLWCFYMSQ